MVPGEGSRRLRLPEDPRAGADEVVVEEALVVAPLPALGVQGRQGLPVGSVRAIQPLKKKESPAEAHPLEPGGGLGDVPVQEGLQRVAWIDPRRRPLAQRLLGLVVGGEEGGIVHLHLFREVRSLNISLSGNYISIAV